MVEKQTNDKLLVFDTTLRDGEQSAGASLTSQDKFRIASQLQKLNVDFSIELNSAFFVCQF